MGLAIEGDEALFVYVWIYCLVWWFVQDGAKVLTYWLVNKYDLFNYRTGALVNVRATHKFDDAKHPLARTSMAMVETKLLERKAEKAMEELQRVSAGAGSVGGAGLARVSAQVGLMRTSLRAGRLDRTSIMQEMGRLRRTSGHNITAELEGADKPAIAAIKELEEAMDKVEIVVKTADAQNTKNIGGGNPQFTGPDFGGSQV